GWEHESGVGRTPRPLLAHSPVQRPMLAGCAGETRGRGGSRMGTRFGLLYGPGGRLDERVDGVVGEGEAVAGMVGAVVVDLELQGVVELALDAFGCLGDVDAGQDG